MLAFKTGSFIRCHSCGSEAYHETAYSRQSDRGSWNYRARSRPGCARENQPASRPGWGSPRLEPQASSLFPASDHITGHPDSKRTPLLAANSAPQCGGPLAAAALPETGFDPSGFWRTFPAEATAPTYRFSGTGLSRLAAELRRVMATFPQFPAKYNYDIDPDQ